MQRARRRETTQAACPRGRVLTPTTFPACADLKSVVRSPVFTVSRFFLVYARALCADVTRATPRRIDVRYVTPFIRSPFAH